ncbi:MAG: bacterial surface protein containing Ig-like domain protein, partial [Bacteroidota bacterium]|nr:bacterial surface protein containing Ig-like domain protein [Bacteroidota bacterium]
MATVGQTLTSPETGWQRIEETNSSVGLLNGSWSSSNNTDCSAGAYKNSTTAAASYGFNFTGT